MASLNPQEHFEIRNVVEDDVDALVELFESAYRVSVPLEVWKWKYRRAPALQQSVAVNAQAELVTHYGGYPMRLYRSDLGPGQEQLVLQIGDIMSRPDVRQHGRGASSLLARTAQHFHRTCCDRRVAFCYGLHAGNSRAFSNRFVGTITIEPAPLRRLEAETFSHPFESEKATVYRIVRLDRAIDEINDLYHRVRNRFGALFQRDSSYLQWRYFDHPRVDYLVLGAFSTERLVGWGVFREREQQLVWGDALFDPEHTAAVPHTLAEASALCGTLAASVTTWFPERPLWWHRALEQIGFRSEPEPQQLELAVTLHLERDAVERLRRSLYYSYGDTDLF